MQRDSCYGGFRYRTNPGHNRNDILHSKKSSVGRTSDESSWRPTFFGEFSLAGEVRHSATSTHTGGFGMISRDFTERKAFGGCAYSRRGTRSSRRARTQALAIERVLPTDVRFVATSSAKSIPAARRKGTRRQARRRSGNRADGANTSERAGKAPPPRRVRWNGGGSFGRAAGTVGASRTRRHRSARNASQITPTTQTRFSCSHQTAPNSATSPAMTRKKWLPCSMQAPRSTRR
jgi:hypothetical protein